MNLEFLKDYKIKSDLTYSQLIKSLGIYSLYELYFWLENLPYGRTSSRTDLNCIVKENKGTCSSKHALFKAITQENNWSDFVLIIGIYKMNHFNTPGIGNAIQDNNLDYIPEAHTYIRYNQKTLDMTNSESSFNRIKNAILLEQEISYDQIGTFKVDLHKDYITQWINDDNISLNLNEIWTIREDCISKLSS